VSDFSQVTEKGYDLNVAYVSGDDLRQQITNDRTPATRRAWTHLDSTNSTVQPGGRERRPDPTDLNIVSANAYLGARGIVKALQAGADIIICGRVSDASPVIGAAWYWHSWTDHDYDQLAGSLIAGHLIECSAYVTGANFAGFTKFKQSAIIHPGFPIAEIHGDGSCVVTKHPGTGGVVNTETVRCQLLYELQGNVYLHSDSKAILQDVRVEQQDKDR
jgi:hypothetical protein